MPASSGTRRGNGAGYGGPANGPGWGGDKRGAGSDVLFAAGDEHRGAHTMDAIEAKRARVARHLDNIEHVALHGEHEANRLNASKAVIDILDPPTKRIARGGDAEAGPVAIKVILEDLTTDVEAEGQEAASAAGQD